MFKMITVKGRLTKTARNAFKTAYIAGSANEMIVFPNAYTNARKFKRVTDMMKSINLVYYSFGDDIYVIHHWFIEAVSDRSEEALIEVKNLIR